MQPSEHSPPLACTNCGNNLAGVSHHTACPNCGKPIQSVLQELAPNSSPPPDATPTPVDPSGLVSSDLPCLACGYNLRGLDTHSTCPECGTPVENSTRGALLVYAGPDFIAQLRQGAACIEWALAIRVVAALAVIAFSFAQTPRPLGLGLSIIASLVVFTLSTYGWWKLTSPHIVLRGLDRLRIWARTFMVLGNLLELSLILSRTGQTPSATGLVNLIMRVSPCILIPLFMLSWLVGVILCLAYAVGLARRIPNPSMATLTSVALWLIPGLIALSIPTFFMCFIAFAASLGAFAFYFVVIDRWRAEFSKLHRFVANAPHLSPQSLPSPLPATPPESPT